MLKQRGPTLKMPVAGTEKEFLEDDVSLRSPANPSKRLRLCRFKFNAIHSIPASQHLIMWQFHFSTLQSDIQLTLANDSVRDGECHPQNETATSA
ncbi:unnamed protein product [Protopolystoma xenopodis]|uniref:Uncharacterized protein n=1 Tax=Protopolystoma xenopodis TaxID=117903 RepID=A0A448WHS3_9PLAT|nr:unnamed protein product [Protopolystoma xenopodis]